MISSFFAYLISAFRAATKEFELVVEVCESRFLSDFVFKFMDRTGSIDGFDGAAVGTNKIGAVLARKEKGKVSRTFMKAKAADHAFATKSLEKSENSCFIALFGEVTAGGEFGQSHGPVVIGETGENGFESLGAAESRLFSRFEELVV